jgi:hypothetical protein
VSRNSSSPLISPNAHLCALFSSIPYSYSRISPKRHSPQPLIYLSFVIQRQHGSGTSARRAHGHAQEVIPSYHSSIQKLTSLQFARIWRLLRLCHHLRNRHLQRSQECGLYSGGVPQGRREVHCWSSKADVAYRSRYTNRSVERCDCQS